MSEPPSFLLESLASLPPKPDDSASQSQKKEYSEALSRLVALAFAAELRRRGLAEALPRPATGSGGAGSERRMAGGIGAKKVDVTWATEESGLLLAITIKSINFKDARSRNYQKNLTNRRGDMLFETVTLHRRFPYAVVTGFFLLDRGAASDVTESRESTFLNAHHRFRLFTGRDDPAGRDEQLERLYIVLFEPDPLSVEVFLAGKPEDPVDLSTVLDEILEITAERNPDFYKAYEGKLIRLRG